MSRADRVVGRSWRRGYAFDQYAKRTGARVIGRVTKGARAGEVAEVLIGPEPRPTWTNPAWRWYHGDNHELASDGRCTRRPCNRYFGGWNGILGDRNEIWFGVPKPAPRAWDAALRLNERLMLVRERAWLTALGPTPNSMTLAEAQANMPEWPHLFTFHAFTAAWLALPDELEQVVMLDAWEDLNPPAHAWVLPAPPSMSADLEKHTVIPP